MTKRAVITAHTTVRRSNYETEWGYQRARIALIRLVVARLKRMNYDKESPKELRK